MSGLLAASQSFWEAFFRDPNVAGPVSALLALVLLVGVPVVALTWRRVVRIRTDAELKKAMIDRGMSAEEIERILQARSRET